MLDEDDVKIAADAMKELEMFMPSVSGTDSKSSKKKYVIEREKECASNVH